MRVPTSWNDRRLLEDEPFRSAFLARKLQSTTRDKKSWFESVAHDLLRVNGGRKAAEAWSKIAFATREGDRPPVKPKINDTSVVFVRVFWQLYGGTEEDAQIILDMARRKNKFVYCLPILVKSAKANVPAASRRNHKRRKPIFKHAATRARNSNHAGSSQRKGGRTPAARLRRSNSDEESDSMSTCGSSSLSEDTPNLEDDDTLMTSASSSSSGSAQTDQYGLCEPARDLHCGESGENLEHAPNPSASLVAQTPWPSMSISIEGPHSIEDASIQQRNYEHTLSPTTPPTTDTTAGGTIEKNVCASILPAPGQGTGQSPVLDSAARKRKASQEMIGKRTLPAITRDNIPTSIRGQRTLPAITRLSMPTSMRDPSVRIPIANLKFNRIAPASPSPPQPSPPDSCPDGNAIVPADQPVAEPTSPIETMPIFRHDDHPADSANNNTDKPTKATEVNKVHQPRTGNPKKNGKQTKRRVAQELKDRPSKRRRSTDNNPPNDEAHVTVDEQEAPQPDTPANGEADAHYPPIEPPLEYPQFAMPRPVEDQQCANPITFVLYDPLGVSAIGNSSEMAVDQENHVDEDSESSDDEALLPVSLHRRKELVPSDTQAPAKPSEEIQREPKRPLLKYPPIWSQSRQELCESFEWFKAYQGGVYHSNGIVKGYLLSAFASRRDRFHHDGKLIISHGGGKAESLHSRHGQIVTQQAEDQLADDKSVRALLATYKNHRPLVLLVDDKYSLFPYDLSAKEVTYAVLGYFFIAHAWAEYAPADNGRGRVVRYKFAFQWCEEQGNPWWTSEGVEQQADALTPAISPPSLQASTSSLVCPRPKPVKVTTVSIAERRPLKPPELYQECGHCKERTPHIYSRGWMCLNPTCTKFWETESGCAPMEGLEYTENFLKLQPVPKLSSGCKTLLPSLPVAPSNNITTNYAFTRGWHCIKCGRLSSRFKWEHWECSNCGNMLKIKGEIRHSKDLKTEPNVNFSFHWMAHNSGILRCKATMALNVAEVQTYILPHDRGKIHHIRGRPIGNLEADLILREYQEQAADGDLQFRRWPLKTHKLRGPLLANYFSQNSGQPYQYVGGSDRTVPFESAPGAVIKALALITKRISQTIPTITQQFNEVLTAAYMERQKMAFHSDNEKGLGPVVAGLSLGSAAVMHFRLHSRYLEADERRGNAISFVLRHGDVLVMDGAAVQEYYDPIHLCPKYIKWLHLTEIEITHARAHLESRLQSDWLAGLRWA